MINVRKSLVLAVPQERKRHVAALRDEMLRRADIMERLMDERDAALEELRQLKIKIARAAEQRVEIARVRAEVAFAMAQRDENVLLH